MPPLTLLLLLAVLPTTWTQPSTCSVGYKTSGTGCVPCSGSGTPGANGGQYGGYYSSSASCVSFCAPGFKCPDGSQSPFAIACPNGTYCPPREGSSDPGTLTPSPCGGGGDGGGFAISQPSQCSCTAPENCGYEACTVRVFAGRGTYGSVDGVGLAAKFNDPRGMVVDATTGMLYVCDYGNHLIRSVDPQGTVVTIAGTGSAGHEDAVGTAAKLSGPYDLDFSLASGSPMLYILEKDNNPSASVRVMNLTTMAVSSLAGGGLFKDSLVDGIGTVAVFSSPRGISVDSNGTYAYVADTSNHVIRRVTIADGTVVTLAGIGSQPAWVDSTNSSLVRFNSPTGIDIVGTSLYVSENMFNKLIRVVSTLDGATFTLAGDPTNNQRVGYPLWADGVGSLAQFNTLEHLAIEPSGTSLLVLDSQNLNIRRVTLGAENTGVVSFYAGDEGRSGSSDNINWRARNSAFAKPLGVATYLSKVFVSEADNNYGNGHQIKVIDCTPGVAAAAAAPYAAWPNTSQPCAYRLGLSTGPCAHPLKQHNPFLPGYLSQWDGNVWPGTNLSYYSHMQVGYDTCGWRGKVVLFPPPSSTLSNISIFLNEVPATISSFASDGSALWSTDTTAYALPSGTAAIIRVQVFSGSQQVAGTGLRGSGWYLESWPPIIPGGACTPTRTASPSATSSPSPTSTETSSPTPSPTPSTTPTGSAPPTPTPSPSPTSSASASETSPATPSPTPTETPTTTGTASTTPTTSPTSSPTASPSITTSTTSTTSASPTPTTSETVSPTPTTSETVSPTPTTSATVSPTPTTSDTVTSTPTVTPSSSPTSSTTPTASNTLTASPTPSTSTTFTSTGTPSATPSSTPSITASMTGSGTLSGSGTGSLTGTGTLTPSTTLTLSSSATLTPSSTPTTSATSSTTFTSTPTPTSSNTPTRTGSSTRTPSRSPPPPPRSASPTPSTVVYYCSGRAAAGCALPTLSLPPFSAAVGDFAGTGVSPSATLLEGGGSGGSGGVGGTLTSLSPSSQIITPTTTLVMSRPGGVAMSFPLSPPPPYATAALRLQLPVAPNVGETVNVSCSGDSYWLGIGVTPPPSAVGAFTLVGDGGGNLALSGGRGGWVGPITLSLNVQLMRSTLSSQPAPTTLTVTCVVTSYATGSGGGGAGAAASRPVSPFYPSSYTLLLPVVLLPPVVPLLNDLLWEESPCSFRSAWDAGKAVPLPPLDVSATPDVAFSAKCSTGTPYSSFLLASSPSALAALRSVSLPSPPSPVFIGSPPIYNMILTSTAATPHMVLVSDVAHPYTPFPAFTYNTTVRVGGVTAVVNWVSPDGSLLSFFPPSFSTLCSSSPTTTSQDCGIQTLTVGDVDVSLAIQIASMTSDTIRYGLIPNGTLPGFLTAATLAQPLRFPVACPPSCPSNWGGVFALSAAASSSISSPSFTASTSIGSGQRRRGRALLPGVAGVGGGSLELGVAAATNDTEAAAAAMDSLSGGLYFLSLPCATYTSPLSGACLNGSSGARCAWGTPGDCAPCPVGALCPGGHRLWPQPGYWIGGESDTTPLACPSPGETTRCPGWNGGAVTLPTIQASGQAIGGGVGFLCGGNAQSGSKGCSTCRKGHFIDSLGQCAVCPSRTYGNAILPLIYSAAFALGAVLFIALVLVMWNSSLSSRRAGAATQQKQDGAMLLRYLSASALQVVWGWVTLQVIVEGLRAGNTRNTALTVVTSWLSLLQWNWDALPPGCTNPFSSSSTTAASAETLAGCLALLALLLLYPSQRVKAFYPPLMVCALVFPTLLFPTLLNNALPQLTCVSQTMSVRGYLVLEGDGTTLLNALAVDSNWPLSVPLDTVRTALAASPNALALLRSFIEGALPANALPSGLRIIAPSFLAATLSVPTLASEPTLVCWEGRHGWSFPLAVVLLVALVAVSLLMYFITPTLLLAKLAASDPSTQDAWKRVSVTWLWPVLWGLELALQACSRFCCSLRKKTPDSTSGGGEKDGVVDLESKFPPLPRPTLPSSLSPSTTGTGTGTTTTAVTAAGESGRGVSPKPPPRPTIKPPRVTPMTAGDYLCCAFTRPPPSPASAVLDVYPPSPALLSHPWLSPWLHWVHFDTRPSSVWLTLLDHGVVLALAIPFAYHSTFTGPDATITPVSQVWSQGTSIFAMLVCILAVWLHWKYRPFAGPNLAWKHYTKLAAFFLAFLITLTNLLTWQAQRAALLARATTYSPQISPASAQSTLTNAAHVLAILVAALTALLCLVVVAVMVWGAAVEVGLTAPPEFLKDAPPNTTSTSSSTPSGKRKVGSKRRGRRGGGDGDGGSVSSRGSVASTDTAQIWMIENPLVGGGSSSNTEIIQGLPLKMLHSLESRGVVIQASGRIVMTKEGSEPPLSPYEEALAQELSILVKQGHALEGGVLYDGSKSGEGGGGSGLFSPSSPSSSSSPLPNFNIAGNKSNVAGVVGGEGGSVPFSIPTDQPPKASSSPLVTTARHSSTLPTPAKNASFTSPPTTGKNVRVIPTSPPTSSPPPPASSSSSSSSSSSATTTLPSLDASHGIPCNDRVVEGGQVFYLDGPGGPALSPGWQRYSDPRDGAVVWYVCVVPPYLTDTPPQPQWDPPFAPIPPPSSIPPPFYPRINPSEEFVVGDRGAKHYLDPKSGELLQEGWRAVTDGVDTWYGNKVVGGGSWKAPVLTRKKKEEVMAAAAVE